MAVEAFKILDRIKDDIEKYMYLRELHLQHPGAYFSLLVSHTEKVLPFIYTPTVGEACTRYFELMHRQQPPRLQSHGLFLSLNDKGRVMEKLRAWPQQNVRVIVVTDGERILGLGDLGAGGMGISEGKITLYSVAAGVDPSVCLPVCLDVGTNNKRLLEDPNYGGLKRERATGAEFDAFMSEFMDSLGLWQPHVLVQFEDFGNHNAFRLLEKYRPTHCTFNDDIQGTAAITLAALLAGLRALEYEAGKVECRQTGRCCASDEVLGVGELLAGKSVLFFGAGEAGTGIGQLIAYCVHRRTGCTMEEARRACHFIDSKGLVCASRRDLQPHKLAFAHDTPFVPTLQDAIRTLKPVALIGVSTIPNSFNEEVIRAMSENNVRPLIFPLSNPTSKAECTFEQAYRWSGGRVLFASGSPFEPVPHRLCSDGLEGACTPAQLAQLHREAEANSADGLVHPAQANNAYVFPALGHAAVLARARTISEECFLVAAEALAAMAKPQQVLSNGALFPPFSHIKDTSCHVMAHLMACMVREGSGVKPAEVPHVGPDGNDASAFFPYCVEHMWSGPVATSSRM